jgi:predicted membrane protein
MKNQKHVKHFNSRKGIITFWSIVLVVVVFLFLKNSTLLGSLYISTFLTWPLILFGIAVLCLIGRNWLLGIVLLATAKFFWIPFMLEASPELLPSISADTFVRNYWYLLVAFIALAIIIQQIFAKDNRWKNRFELKTSELDEDGFIKSYVIFSSNDKIYFNENFKGGKFATVFGAQEIDLRKCVIQKNEKAYLDLSVVFGSYTVWVPAEWAVQLNAEGIFSSLEDRRVQPSEGEERETLIIDGKCVFSSLEIRS